MPRKQLICKDYFTAIRVRSQQENVKNTRKNKQFDKMDFLREHQSSQVMMRSRPGPTRRGKGGGKAMVKASKK